MPTTPSQLDFTEEVQSSTIGDQVPNPNVGSLALFPNQNGTWYAKNSSGTVTPLSGLQVVNNTDGTITVSTVGSTATVSRAAITGAVSVPAGSDVSTLTSTITAGGPTGSASTVPVITYNAAGQLTAVTTATITPSAIGAVASVTQGDTTIVIGGTSTNPTVARAAITGDISIPAGSDTATLATVLSTPGSEGSSSTVPVLTANGKGLITALSSATITPTAIGAAPNPVPIADISSIGADTILGNNTASSGPVLALTSAQVNTLLFNREIVDVTENTYANVVLNATASASANVTALNTIFSTAPAGTVIYFPPGVCYINANLNAMTSNYTIYGCYGASYVTMIAAQTTGAWFTADASSANPTAFINMGFACGTSGFAVNCSGTNSVIEFGNTLQPVVAFCEFSGNGFTNVMFNCLDFTGTNSANGGVIIGCNFGAFNGTAMNFEQGQGSTSVQSCLIEGLNSVGRAVAGISIQTPASAVNGGSVLIDNCDVIGCSTNLLINAGTGSTLASVFVNNSFFDQALVNALSCTGGGTIARCRFLGCWFTLSASAAASASCINVTTTGSSIHAGLIFEDCFIYETPVVTAGGAIGINIAACADFTIDGCQIAGWTTGVQITGNSTAGSTKAQVINNKIGPSGIVGANTTGIILAAGAAAYGSILIQNNDVSGNTTALTNNVTTNVPTNAALYRITDNAGINPHGAVTTPTFPTSTTVVTNTTGYRVTVYTKFATTAPTNVSVNGVAFGTSIGAGLASEIFTAQLDPGGTISFTFATAPTGWVWIGN
jgi:hypothetical protein